MPPALRRRLAVIASAVAAVIPPAVAAPEPPAPEPGGTVQQPGPCCAAQFAPSPFLTSGK